MIDMTVPVFLFKQQNLKEKEQLISQITIKVYLL